MTLLGDFSTVIFRDQSDAPDKVLIFVAQMMKRGGVTLLASYKETVGVITRYHFCFEDSYRSPIVLTVDYDGFSVVEWKVRRKKTKVWRKCVKEVRE